MIGKFPYLMEYDGENDRLDRKTDIKLVQQQARWAGLKPGMRVADIGCGSGKASRALFEAAQPGGQVIGVDGSQQRIDYAMANYGTPGLDFVCRNVTESWTDFGFFDFVWVRFFLEYFRSTAFELVARFADILKPGGILCLIDLDRNCLNHYELPPHLAETIHHIMTKAEEEADFDARIGIKLYSFLYDLGFEQIDVTMQAYHLIFGALKELDDYNWTQKIEVAARRTGYAFEKFDGGYQGFKKEFLHFFSDPRRFSYTPLIICRGRKPHQR